MYKDILLAVDLGDENSWKKALPAALEMAKAFGSTLHLVAVVPDVRMSLISQYFPENYEEEVVRKTEEELAAFTDSHVSDQVPHQHHVAHGTIYEEILAAAHRSGADLIVMAAHRPELQDYLIGPNAARVVRHATCSVLVIRD